MADPSIPKPTNPGTTPGQKVAGTDGAWYWLGPSQGWKWGPLGDNKVSAEGDGTPTPAHLAGDFSDPKSVENHIGDFISGAFMLPKQIASNAPGATYDTSGAMSQEQRMQALMGSLQQQASTGDGAWQDNFTQGVAAAKNSASALGQSFADEGGSFSGGLRNIVDAQGGVAQRAVGEEQTLREQAKKDAEGQISAIAGAQGSADIERAAQEAAAQRSRRQANLGLIDQSQKQYGNTMGGFGQMFGTGFGMGGASDGGKVPGSPVVFGDDSRNDTVPAMLSPGEIVVPRSHADTPEHAAQFVAAVKAGKVSGSGGGMADGGGINQTGLGDVGPSNAGDVAEWILAPSFAHAGMYGKLRDKAMNETGGGTLDTSALERTGKNFGPLDAALSRRAGGNGSVAGVMSQQQNDAQMEDAMGAMNARAPAGAVTQATGERGVKSAAGAAAKREADQSGGRAALANSIGTQRSLADALANAKHEAGWSDTMLRAGMSLENQQRLLGMMGGAGQAAMGFINQNKSNKLPTKSAKNDYGENFGDPNGGFRPGEGDTGQGDFPTGGDGTAYAAFGGEIPDDEHERAHKFVEALMRRRAA